MTVQLIVCHFCHTRQPNAWDCAVCARPLHERPTLQGLVTETLPELELHAIGGGENVAATPVEGLEQTALVEHFGAPQLEGLDGSLLEPTLLEAAPALPVEMLPDLEPSLTADPPAPKGPVVCRYCGTPWREGSSRFCARCAMDLF
ncbi:hypothetical protein [Vulgatibacter incomptus]|uniref:Uncharacterized protein n=1 Tax=Vulgatibacter incomptus TaxID=1391653 RepID=A0A0K1PAQ9_9BACT|nr:hypothetical protein [Vulgatibacter incomptus]AKU90496.1 hypothetical protein AKJ08_0883 [Vulgatibacter incomptus]